MSILKVAQMGNPVLRTKCRDLTLEEIGSEKIKQLIEDMKESVLDYSGVGLAAPQVHSDINLALIGGEEGNRYEEEVRENIIINASYKPLSEETIGVYEGCLSLTGIRAYVQRFKKIEVKYMDLNGDKKVEQFEGFEAIVYQHEIDHLNGILFIDLCDCLSLSFEEEYQKYHDEEL